MQLFNRSVLSLTAAAIVLAGCGPSLPEAPLVLETDPEVSEPVQSAPPPPPPPAVATVSATPEPAPLPSVPATPEPAPLPSPLPESSDVTFEVVGETESGGIRVLHKASYNPFDRDNGKSFRAINTLEFYRSELSLHSIETAKPVDFRTAQVLASSIGEKPTGGYTVSVTNIEEFEDNVVVTVVQTIPGPACITTQGVTHPFEFVVIPSVKPIEIFERQRINQCQ